MLLSFNKYRGSTAVSLLHGFLYLPTLHHPHTTKKHFTHLFHLQRSTTILTLKPKTCGSKPTT
jgi:hypothetical protein